MLNNIDDSIRFKQYNFDNRSCKLLFRFQTLDTTSATLLKNR